MNKKNLLSKNKLASKDYFPFFTTKQQSLVNYKDPSQEIYFRTSRNSLNNDDYEKKFSKTAQSFEKKELAKSSKSKFEYFIRSTFRNIESPSDSSKNFEKIKPITMNSFRSISKSIPITKNNNFMKNSINIDKEEYQKTEISKKEKDFVSHLNMMKTQNPKLFSDKNLFKKENLENKKSLAIDNMNMKEYNRNRFRRRVNIIKFINGLKLTNQKKKKKDLNPVNEDIFLNSKEEKRLRELLSNVQTFIKQILNNISILLSHHEQNHKMAAKILNKINGYHKDIGETFLDLKKEELIPFLDEKKFYKNVMIKLQISHYYSLWFLEKLSYFNENLFNYILDKEKEWFELKTDEIVEDLTSWRYKKSLYLKKIRIKKNEYMQKKNLVEDAANLFQPKNYIPIKLLWENLVKNERGLGEFNHLSKFQKNQWQLLQNIEDHLN